jgi:hypothetical protein
VVLAFSPAGLPAGTHATALTVGYHDGSASTSASATVEVTTTTLALLRVSDWDGCPDCGAWNEQPFDFGAIAVGATVEHTFHLTNVGAQAATAVAADPLPGPFAFKGGAFPGTGGDCGAQLAAGQSCRIVVTFTPPGVGRSESWLHVRHGDGSGDTRSADRWLAGSGTDLAVLEVRTCPGCGPTGWIEFGTTGVVVERTLTVANVGGGDASSLAAGPLGEGFAFKGAGGTWPGAGGTCSATLAKATAAAWRSS